MRRLLLTALILSSLSSLMLIRQRNEARRELAMVRLLDPALAEQAWTFSRCEAVVTVREALGR